jgi:predicted DNA-binding ribbon-helix-helix protein
MAARPMKSAVIKRSVVIAGHQTSIALEDAFWNALKDIAAGRHLKVSQLLADIDSQRQTGNLSSALRLFVLNHAIEKSNQATPSTMTSSSMCSAP